MGSITIQKTDIVHLETDAVVNAANEGLWAGSGVCGALFRAAGHDRLQAACDAIGHCDTGSAVITPGFDLRASYIIHAVGPIWAGGSRGEPALLYSAYQAALSLAVEHGCQSVGFPLISSGIFGYPLEDAWRTALKSCHDFLQNHPDIDLEIVFAVRRDSVLEVGRAIGKDVAPELR